MIQKPRIRRVALWRVARWVPAALVLAPTAYLLFMFSQGGMARVRAWYLLQFVPPALGVIALGMCAAYGLATRRIGKRTAATGLLAVAAMLPALQMLIPVLAYPASIDQLTPSAVVRLPANVPLLVLWGGDDLAHNQHAAVPDQRWAYDLAVKPYLVDSRNLKDFGCYGVTLVAPASGIVVDAHDGEPDEAPGQLSNNSRSPEGNRVVIRLETETYLVIAHLAPGSVVVRPGQRVTEGAPIGRCGNSGNTSEPHIHIHHQRQNPLESPHGVAEGLPLYFRDHDGDPMPLGGFGAQAGQLVPTGATVRHIGK